jgi:hypothetical protein
MNAVIRQPRLDNVRLELRQSHHPRRLTVMALDPESQDVESFPRGLVGIIPAFDKTIINRSQEVSERPATGVRPSPLLADWRRPYVDLHRQHLIPPKGWSSGFAVVTSRADRPPPGLGAPARAGVCLPNKRARARTKDPSAR